MEWVVPQAVEPALSTFQQAAMGDPAMPSTLPWMPGRPPRPSRRLERPSTQPQRIPTFVCVSTGAPLCGSPRQGERSRIGTPRRDGIGTLRRDAIGTPRREPAYCPLNDVVGACTGRISPLHPDAPVLPLPPLDPAAPPRPPTTPALLTSEQVMPPLDSPRGGSARQLPLQGAASPRQSTASPRQAAAPPRLGSSPRRVALPPQHGAPRSPRRRGANVQASACARQVAGSTSCRACTPRAVSERRTLPAFGDAATSPFDGLTEADLFDPQRDGEAGSDGAEEYLDLADTAELNERPEVTRGGGGAIFKTDAQILAEQAIPQYPHPPPPPSPSPPADSRILAPDLEQAHPVPWALSPPRLPMPHRVWSRVGSRDGAVGCSVRDRAGSSRRLLRRPHRRLPEAVSLTDSNPT